MAQDARTLTSSEFHAPDLCLSPAGVPILSWERHRYYGFMKEGISIGTGVMEGAGWHLNTELSRCRAMVSPRIAVDEDGRLNYVWADTSDGDFDVYFTTTPIVTSVKKSRPSPGNRDFRIYPSYPNPFNGRTTITIRLRETELVRVSVEDILGREVAMLFRGELEPGEHRFPWDAVGFPSGMYVCRVLVNSTSTMMSLLLLK